MMIHDLKIENDYLENLILGRKKAEIRFNDRDYQRGDLLRFKKYHLNHVDEYLFEITHIATNIGLEKGYVVLSIMLMDYEENK